MAPEQVIFVWHAQLAMMLKHFQAHVYRANLSDNNATHAKLLHLTVVPFQCVFALWPSAHYFRILPETIKCSAVRCPTPHFHNYFNGCSFGDGVRELFYECSIKTIVPRSWYCNCDTKILVPRSWYRAPARGSGRLEAPQEQQGGLGGGSPSSENYLWTQNQNPP